MSVEQQEKESLTEFSADASFSSDSIEQQGCFDSKTSGEKAKSLVGGGVSPRFPPEFVRTFSGTRFCEYG